MVERCRQMFPLQTSHQMYRDIYIKDDGWIRRQRVLMGRVIVSFVLPALILTGRGLEGYIPCSLIESDSRIAENTATSQNLLFLAQFGFPYWCVHCRGLKDRWKATERPENLKVLRSVRQGCKLEAERIRRCHLRREKKELKAPVYNVSCPSTTDHSLNVVLEQHGYINQSLRRVLTLQLLNKT